jgi:hypothetical protein
MCPDWAKDRKDLKDLGREKKKAYGSSNSGGGK